MMKSLVQWVMEEVFSEWEKDQLQEVRMKKWHVPQAVQKEFVEWVNRQDLKDALFWMSFTIVLSGERKRKDKMFVFIYNIFCMRSRVKIRLFLFDSTHSQ